MSTDMTDIPYVFTAAWIGLLGAYLLWMSQCTKARKAHQIAPILILQMDLMTLTQQASPHVATNATEDTDDFPAFSPEGMISWMFERCNRRFEDAMQERHHKCSNL